MSDIHIKTCLNLNPHKKSSYWDKNFFNNNDFIPKKNLNIKSLIKIKYLSLYHDYNSY